MQRKNHTFFLSSFLLRKFKITFFKFLKMTRVKRGNVSRKRHKKVLNLTKGFRGAASLLFRTANQQNMKALRSAYTNRRKKKRNFRRLWILRLNAAIRANGFNYSEFLFFLKNSKIVLNRKVLAQFSICDPEMFVKFIHSIEKK